MTCDLKPTAVTTRGKKRTSLSHLLRTDPPAICRQATVTVPPEAGAKFAQELRFQSPLWRDVYSELRSLIEGSNGSVKDGSYEALGDATKRRVLGVAAQSLFVSFQLLALNLRRIDTFVRMKAVDPDGSRRAARRAKRRQTKGLPSWMPAPILGSESPPGNSITLD